MSTSIEPKKLSSRRGGRRPGAGRPAINEPVTTVTLSEVARQELRILTLHRRQLSGNSRLSQRAVVQQLIHAAWVELDEATQAAAEELAECVP